jgi:Protein HRI1
VTGFDVHGAWMRRSATVEDGPAFETQFVVWLQAGSCYADVRVPLHPAADERCFAGRSGWDGEGYRWTHHLDLEPGSPAADDIGSLVWEADALVERGMFPTATEPVRYEEFWVPLDDSHGPYLALESPQDVFVRVGAHAIGISDRRADGAGFAAAYWRRRADGWRTDASIGDCTALRTPDDITPDALPQGWKIMEQGIAESDQTMRTSR